MEKTGNKSCISFKLFGSGLAYRNSQGEEWIRLNESDLEGTGKKLTAFLEYLIINHGKDISSEELIETGKSPEMR